MERTTRTASWAGRARAFSLGLGLAACGGVDPSSLEEPFDGGPDVAAPVDGASARPDATVSEANVRRDAPLDHAAPDAGHPVDAGSPPDDVTRPDAGHDGSRGDSGGHHHDGGHHGHHDAGSRDALAPRDAGFDSRGDARRDSGIDIGRDAGTDARHDSGVDARHDTGADAGVDSPIDTGVDSGTDAGLDAPVDAGLDAAGIDGGPDSGTDAGVDSGPPCPASAPAALSSCPTTGQACVYATEDCTCSGGFTGNYWSCSTCPSTLPADGDACDGLTSTGLCRYDATDCSCNLGKWACGGCPSVLPTDGSGCTVNGLECAFPDESCQCSETFGGLQWGCRGSCPPDPPTPDQPCDVPGNDVCVYGDGSCTCTAPSFGAKPEWSC